MFRFLAIASGKYSLFELDVLSYQCTIYFRAARIKAVSNFGTLGFTLWQCLFHSLRVQIVAIANA